jgi:SAM-dependent methyltransferase
MTDAAQMHADQVVYWNGAGGQRWISQQARRDQMLAQFGEIAVERSGAKPGETVLDIGCGCGETSVMLAERVGPTGHVLAADVSAPILAEARARLAPYPQVETALADASAYSFPPGAADLLFSRFGVMFFGDPVAAFVNLRKGLKPGGRLTFACWRDPKENPWMTAPMQAALKHVPPMPRPGPTDPGPFAFANDERVAGILTAAGFQPPRFEKIDVMCDLAGGNGLDAAVAASVEFGPASRLLEDQPEDVRDAARASIREMLQEYTVGNDVKAPAAIWIVTSAVSGA